MKKCECNPKSVSRSHGSSMNQKFRSLEKACLQLRKKVEVSEKFKFSNLEIFSHLKNLDGMEKTCKLKARSSFLKKTKYALTPKLLSHSPNSKWCK